MPEMDGVELITWLQRHCPGSRIVMTTGNAASYDSVTALMKRLTLTDQDAHEIKAELAALQAALELVGESF